MIKILKLTKILFKTSFSNLYNKSGNKSNRKILMYFFVFAYLAGVMAFLSYNLLDGFIQINQEKFFIGIILLAITGFATFQSIFSSINVLYFSKDSEYILPLPLKPYQIVCAKTFVMIFLEYIIEIFIGLVPFLIYATKTEASFSFYITMIIALLLIPVLPILMVSTIIMIIMSFAKLTKNRNRFQLITTILTLFICISVSILSSNIGNNMSNEDMANMFFKTNGMLEIINGKFLILDYLIKALTTNEISVIVVELSKTIFITIIGFITYLFIANKIYLKGLVGNLFSGTSKKTNTKIAFEKYQNSKLYKTYIGKEFKTLARNPVFFMQCLAPAIFIPILFLGLYYMQINSGMGIESFKSLIDNINIFPIICVVLGIIELFSMFIYISITAISRDGKNAVFMKYIPIPLYNQYIYKIIPNIIMSIISIFITLIAVKKVLQLNLLILSIIFLIAFLKDILQSILMLIVDLKRPKLEWDSEYAVVKQNFNLIFPALYGLMNLVLLIVFGICLKNIEPYRASSVLVLVFLILIYISNRYLYKNQKELADKII